MSEAPKTVKISTGIMGIDDMLYGGLPPGSQTLLIGETGTAKTLMALNIAYSSASAGLPVVYLSIDESKDSLLSNMKTVFPNFEAVDVLVSSGKLFVLERNLIIAIKAGDVIERFLVVLENAIKANDAKIMIIDSLGMIRVNLNDDRTFTKAIALIVDYLRSKGVTAVIISDTLSRTATKVPGLFDEAMFDNIIMLKKHRDADSRTRYTVTVVKLRYSQYKNIELQFDITPNGIIARQTQSGLQA